jgi:hypothetical protein
MGSDVGKWFIFNGPRGQEKYQIDKKEWIFAHYFLSMLPLLRPLLEGRSCLLNGSKRIS